MERTHRIAFMAANKIPKADLPSMMLMEINWRRLIYATMVFVSNRVTLF